jgi:signal transduction histidine kinase
VFALGILAIRDYLPSLIPQATLALVVVSLDIATPELTSIPMLMTQLGVGLVYLAAAVIYGLAYAKSAGHRPHHRFLATGLIFAGFSQLHFAVVPGVYSDLWTSGDVLRMLFYGIVGVGVAAAARGDLIELRRANLTLQRLRESDARRATAEERARMAREVHDGLVQELWLARLTGGRLGSMPDLPAEAREIVERLDAVLESALGEARQAVVTLQPSPDPSFGALLERFVQDYADRFGFDVTCTVEGDLSGLPSQAQGDLLRICREALTNVRKHADASVADVRLEGIDGRIRLSVRDDGIGFDSSARRAGYGLESMRQRAQRIGARLDVESTPGSGTLVTVKLPT